MDTRIGPKMQDAINILATHGYAASKAQLARAVGPHGSTKYGYEIVDRLLRAGLADLDPGHEHAARRGLGAVVLTDRGRVFAS